MFPWAVWYHVIVRAICYCDTFAQGLYAPLWRGLDRRKSD
jgi:hypothetical protein